MSITFRLEEDDGKWHAYCPELNGCHTFGNTKAEAINNLKDAVMLYMEDEIENQSLKAVVHTIELNKTKKQKHV